MRTDICDAIEDIPEAIKITQELQELHPNAVELHQHASGLYVAILDVLVLSISWYNRKSWLKFKDGLSKGTAYDRDLDNAFQTLSKFKSGIEGQANHQGRLKQRQLEGLMVSGFDTVSGLLLDVIYTMRLQLTDAQKDVQKQRLWQEDQNRLLEDIQKQRDNDRRRDMAINVERKDALMRFLRYNPASASADLYDVLSADPQVKEDTGDRVASILQSPEVAKWLGKPAARALIINGSEEEHRPDSATSLFSAMLLRAIACSQPRLPLMYWFCGEHIHQSVEQMLRGLVAQLLDKSSPDMRTLPARDVGRPDRVRHLTSLLQWVLKAQLQHTPVICILDGVSHYEDQTRYKDLCYVFQKLSELVDRNPEGDRHPLKLLLTSPTRAMDICDSQAARRADILDLEDEVPGEMYDLEELDVLEHTEKCLDLF